MKRLIALLAIVLTLSLGITRPKPARADTGESLAIAAICLAVYVGIVLVATKLVYGAQDNGQAMADDPEKAYAKPAQGIEPGNRCGQQAGGITVACW